MLDNPHPILTDIRSNVLEIYESIEDDGTCADLPLRILSITTLIQHLCAVHSDYVLSTVLVKTDSDNFCAQYAVEAAIVAELVTRCKGWDKPKRATTVNAALTMNIGAIHLHNEFHLEGGILSQGEIMELDQHPIESVKVLKYNGVEDKLWLKAVYQHHELKDGSGMPSGLTEDKICDPAKALAIADAFLQMTFSDPETNPITPIKILHQLYIKHHKQLDTNMLRLFTEHNSPYPAGSVNKMESGKLAIVIQPARNGQETTAYYVSDKNGILLDDDSYELVDVQDSVEFTLPIYHDYNDILVSNVWGFNRKAPTKADFHEGGASEEKTKEEILPTSPVEQNTLLTMEDHQRSSMYLDNSISVHLPQNLLRMNKHVSSGKYDATAIYALLSHDGMVKEFYENSVYSKIGTSKVLPADLHDYGPGDCVDLCFEYHFYKLGSKPFNETFIKQAYTEARSMASIMQKVVAYTEYDKPIQAYIAGLYHNLGKLQLIDRIPEYWLSMKDAVANQVYLNDFEDTTFKLNHSLLTAAIVDLFWLPKEIKIAVNNQHAKSLSHISDEDADGRLLTACLIFSHYLSTKDDKPYYEWAQVKDEVLKTLDLNDKLIKEIARSVK